MLCIWLGRRVTRDKGVKELIIRFLAIAEADENVYLLLAGDMEKDFGLEENTLSEIKTNPRIYYLGPQRDIEKFYAAIDVLAAPSYCEGFGMVAI